MRLTELQLLDNGGGADSARAGIYADQLTGLVVQGGRIVPRSGPPPTLADAIRTTEARGVAIRGADLTGRVDLASGSNAAQVIGNIFRYGALNLAESPDVLVRRNTFVWTGVSISQTNRAQVIENVLISGRGIRSANADGTRNGYAATDLDAARRWIDDGLHTNVPVGSAVVLARNLTSQNADFGIEALPLGGVRDGGGNVSTGDPTGCAGVACAYRG